jgi:transketolase
MRNEFAKIVTEMAEADPRVVLLMGDIGNKLFDDYRKKFADRFYNCGVAEANMMSVASGLALNGFRPFVYSITPFITTRCLEQIRVGVCYHEAPVTIVGTGSGLSYTDLGPTHHSCEDISFLRSLPEMTVYAPADSLEVRACAKLILSQNHPAYMRIGKKGEPALHLHEPEFKVGEPYFMKKVDQARVCLLSTGTIGSVAKSLQASLQERGVPTSWASLPNIKPLQVESIRRLAAEHSVVVTLEEHSEIGGMGSAMAEFFIDNNMRKTRLLRFGTKDWFLHETGNQEYARRRYGLTPEAILPQVLSALES